MRPMPQPAQPNLTSKEAGFFSEMKKHYNLADITRYYYNSVNQGNINLQSEYSYVISTVFIDTVTMHNTQFNSVNIANYIVDSILVSKDFLNQVELQGLYNENSLDKTGFYFIFKYNKESKRLKLTYKEVENSTEYVDDL